MPNISIADIKDVLKKGTIEKATVATINSSGFAAHGFLNAETQASVKEEVFQCASLSKPVFAYLVLKLIHANKTNSDSLGLGKFKWPDKTPFDLDTPLFEVFRDKVGNILKDDENPFFKKFIIQPDVKDNEEVAKARTETNLEAIAKAKKITTKRILSHTTGLLIDDSEPYKFQFTPGEQHYAYSGPGIVCLQAVIDELTDSNLELLSEKFIFCKEALDMPGSTYGAESVAANSLEITAKNYLKFITEWIKDPDLKYAFNPIEPAHTMKNDYFAKKQEKSELDKCFVENVIVADEIRDQVSWGLGVGLVKKGDRIIGIYHTGDMGKDGIEWRSGFGALIDEKGECTEVSIYLTRSSTGNGHMLAEHVLPKDLEPALGYFFPTYGFARNPDELDGANFFGLNPNILKPKIKEEAEKTKQPKESEAVLEHSSSQQYKEKLQEIKSSDYPVISQDESHFKGKI